jgi:hypothetical protein
MFDSFGWQIIESKITKSLSINDSIGWSDEAFRGKLVQFRWELLGNVAVQTESDRQCVHQPDTAFHQGHYQQQQHQFCIIFVYEFTMKRLKTNGYIHSAEKALLMHFIKVENNSAMRSKFMCF